MGSACRNLPVCLMGCYCQCSFADKQVLFLVFLALLFFLIQRFLSTPCSPFCVANQSSKGRFWKILLVSDHHSLCSNNLSSRSCLPTHISHCPQNLKLPISVLVLPISVLGCWGLSDTKVFLFLVPWKGFPIFVGQLVPCSS